VLRTSPGGVVMSPRAVESWSSFSSILTNIPNDRQVPRKPRLVGGVERHNGSRAIIKNEISFPGSPALWAGSFTIC
jgi:hypothetical protein